MLRLDGDRTRPVALEHSADHSAQLVDARNVEACHVPAGQLLPGDVVEKEVRPRRIRQAGRLEVVDLHMVEPRHLAKQPQTLTRAPQRRKGYLCRFEPLDRQLLEPVDLARDQPHRLAVAGEPDRLPGVPNRQEARTQVARRRVEKPLDRVWRSPCNEQIARRVIAEQILKDVGAVADPAILFVEMLVRVDERQRLDLVL
jgi:hypothetical protein